MMTFFFHRAGIGDNPGFTGLRGRRRRRSRGGAYVVLFALVLTILLGFGALAIDGSVYRFGVVEAQDVADTAAHAAVLTLKRTGDQNEARTAAETVTAANTIAGLTPELEALDFGNWDTDAFVFTPGGSPINAVRAQVGRTGEEAIGFGLAPVLGYTSADILEPAVAATRTLEIVLVMDITISWEQWNFVLARDAALAFLDVLHTNHGEADVIGMSVFFGKYAWEFTPFTSVQDSATNPNLIRNDWEAMEIASLAGDYNAAYASGGNATTKHIACDVYATNNSGGIPISGRCSSGSSCYQPSNEDNHAASSPPGGCFPDMPRAYFDEAGTDYTTGIEMARTMFSERNDPSTYRAIVILTDGMARGYTASSTREDQGYVETRWREYERPSPHSTAEIEADTPIAAEDIYLDYGANVWFVSFRDPDTGYMSASAKGDGYYAFAETADEIVEIFERIATSLPVAVVE